MFAYDDGEFHDLAFWREKSLCVIRYLINGLSDSLYYLLRTEARYVSNNYYFAINVIYICIFRNGKILQCASDVSIYKLFIRT